MPHKGGQILLKDHRKSQNSSFCPNSGFFRVKSRMCCRKFVHQQGRIHGRGAWVQSLLPTQRNKEKNEKRKQLRLTSAKENHHFQAQNLFLNPSLITNEEVIKMNFEKYDHSTEKRKKVTKFLFLMLIASFGNQNDDLRNKVRMLFSRR